LTTNEVWPFLREVVGEGARNLLGFDL
jgi:hypothetical protein